MGEEIEREKWVRKKKRGKAEKDEEDDEGRKSSIQGCVSSGRNACMLASPFKTTGHCARPQVFSMKHLRFFSRSFKLLMI